jgi:hypothetical protein
MNVLYFEHIYVHTYVQKPLLNRIITSDISDIENAEVMTHGQAPLMNV